MTPANPVSLSHYDENLLFCSLLLSIIQHESYDTFLLVLCSNPIPILFTWIINYLPWLTVPDSSLGISMYQ